MRLNDDVVPTGQWVRFADQMSRGDAERTVRAFGEARVLQGDEFDVAATPGYYFYATGDARTSIIVWGPEDGWSMSVFSCARMRMRPTLELYRYVSRWRSTCGLGAPYVVEAEGEAAVMFEQSIGARQLASDTSAWRLIASTIDVVGETASIMAHDLDGADGFAPTARGVAGLVSMCGWWDVQDDRVRRLIGLP